MSNKITSGAKSNRRTAIQLSLAQYSTSVSIAEFMASLFFDARNARARILDPGAGDGILGLTLARHLKSKGIESDITSVEIDRHAYSVLRHNMRNTNGLESNLINDDFIDRSLLMEESDTRFSHIILNPPYFKIKTNSLSSRKLQSRGIHITNIYAAFVWLSARLLKDNGQLVAIIPRSFCNGPYFLKFRHFMTDKFSIDGIHEFGSRSKAFAQDNVLQENVIIHISKQRQAETIKLTHSTDHSFTGLVTSYIPAKLIIPEDTHRNICIPAPNQTVYLNEHLHNTVGDLGVTVSTGPVVDFRLRENIVTESGRGGVVPLLYPAHISGYGIHWPLSVFKKAGQYYKPMSSKATRLALEGAHSSIQDKNVLPLDGCYVVVRRFSSKEEKRRIFAAVVEPEDFESTNITFENHLNYFHIKKHGLDKNLAYGLCAYLNTNLLDEYFRIISGHTQVNANDLKHLPYPTRDQLVQIGATFQNLENETLNDDMIRAILEL